jgi:hypothetical protein
MQCTALGAQILDASYLTTWTSDAITAIAKPGSSIATSLVTDTCNTQRAVGKRISLPNSDHHYIFWVPCDSHGLQLLVKDILAIPAYQKMKDLAQDLAVALTSSHKQLAILHQLMIKHYKKPFALVLLVITR